MPTIGVVANVFNEAPALPGWLEAHTTWADDVRVYHSGPGGSMSSDGTIELLERWKIPYKVGSIDEGFGAVRTAAVRSSQCDWVCLLDADERLYQSVPILTCSGDSTPPDEVNQILQAYDDRNDRTAVPSNWENLAKLGAHLRVESGEVFNQALWLRTIIQCGSLDQIITVRRHWHDFGWKRPTQNWHQDPDRQGRIIRNLETIYFDAGTRMHERICGVTSSHQPDMTRGPFFDHYHIFFKRQAVETRRHAIATYDAIHEGRKPPTLEEYREGKR